MTGEKRTHYYFIDYLRVLGMFLVMWPHLTANLNPEWKPLQLVQWLINRPLAIGQNFGALGVSLFFIISGFLMCETSQRVPEKPDAYFLYKTAGIILPLWSAMLGFFLFIKVLGLIPGFSCYWSQFSAQDWIRAATLYNFALLQPERVNGVLWFLVPYLLGVLLMTVYRTFSRKPSICFVQFSLAFTGAVFITAEYLPLAIAANAVYIPILLLGYLANLWNRSEEKRNMITACGVMCYFLLVCGFYRFLPNDYENERYILSAVLALLIFVGCLGRSLEKETPGAVRFLSQISYSFYILHSLYGGFVISALNNHLPYTVCLLLGIAVSVMAAWINYRFVERPVKKALARFAERKRDIAAWKI